MDVHISRIRQKISRPMVLPDVIKVACAGMGYQFSQTRLGTKSIAALSIGSPINSYLGFKRAVVRIFIAFWLSQFTRMFAPM